MIERHIDFNVLPDRGPDFERFFAEQYRPEAAKSDGFIKLELLREAQSPRYQMIFRWEHADAAAGWRNSPVHEGLQPALNALHTGMTITVYEVVA